MNNYIKTIVGVIAIIAILIIIGITAFGKKTNQPEPVPNVSNISEENTTEEKADVIQGSTEADIELRKDRTGDARGAQKENKGASDLQNDLNSINP
jgi:hypothetical protein